MSRRGSALLGTVKLLAVILVGLPVMRFAFQQADANGQGTLWIAAAVIVPVLIAFAGWAVRDSGNLRELIGRFNDHKQAASEKVAKLEDAHDRILRELGGAAEFRLQVLQRLDQFTQDSAAHERRRHDLRNEMTALVGAVELRLSERDDKQDERLRSVERLVDRGNG